MIILAILYIALVLLFALAIGRISKISDERAQKIMEATKHE